MDNKILLNKVKSKLSNNVATNIKSTIESNSRLLPVGDFEVKLDEYKRYIDEKKKSNKYRLSFSINPICSNILFNSVSEIIYKEGSDECVFIGDNEMSDDFTKFINNKNVTAFLSYKGIAKTDKKTLNRQKMIQDTSYSHPEIGDITYHCGYDIFNNHFLKNKEFSIVNKISKNSKKREWFNTIYDYARYFDGTEVDESIDDLSTGIIETGTTNVHLYQIDTLYTFEESINENLIEKDGWIGFTNKTRIDIPNYVVSGNTSINITLNKCLNNKRECEFVDMYPDRTLYSFTPKVNKYRNNRLENNWDYCLTYPYKNYYDNEIVTFECNDFKVNGLECNILNDLLVEDDNGDIYINDYYGDGSIITLKTVIKNNFDRNSIIDIVLIGYLNDDDFNNKKISNIRLPNFEKIVGVGYKGADLEYAFKIYGDQFIEYLYKFELKYGIDIRVRRVSNGAICKYYFREFKRIPNMKNSNKRDIDSSNDIDYNFNTSINDLGFSKNIYSDAITQILFNDDIEIGGIKDNLGRPLSEIYLTIVKNNNGHEKWYKNKKYRGNDITFSHCFGEVTSGIDIKDATISDYNIHKIHNLSTELYGMYNNAFDSDPNGLFDRVFITENDSDGVIVRRPYVLENDIKINGSYDNDISGRTNTFLGDIVEFSVNQLKETKLEDVLHRFNTAQREYFYKDKDNSVDTEFLNIKKDEIFYDDYEIESGSKFMSYEEKIGGPYYYNAYYIPDGEVYRMFDGTHVPVNIFPEGYYYKPHYKIQLKEYKDKVEQGKHTLIVVNGDVVKNGSEYSFSTSKNFYLEVMKELYLFHRKTNEKKIATITKVEGRHFNKIKINVLLNDGEGLNDYIIFKPNSEMPLNAYDLNDGTGRYIWRNEKDDNEYDQNSEVSKHTFTNGAHYFNHNITFFLRRQDPNGDFGLSNANSSSPLLQNLTIMGNENDYSNEEYISEEEGRIC